MRKILFATVLVSLLGGFAFVPTKQFTVDTKSSTLKWTGYYLFSFGEHFGDIQLQSGTLTTEGNVITGGTFVVDMKSIADEDMKWNDGGEDLSNHLKAEDFFDVAKFPTAQFSITKVESITDARDGQPNVDITGALTIKGITNEVKFPARVSVTDKTITASSKFKIDRTKWNVRYESSKFFSEVGNSAISDAIGIELNLHATLTTTK